MSTKASGEKIKAEWSLILLLGTAFLISRYDFALMSLALPDIQTDLGVPEEDLGSFVGWTRLGAFAAIPLAYMADWSGRKRLLLVTIAGFTICTVATAFVENWQQYVIMQAAARAFTSADEILSAVMILEYVVATRRGWAVGVLAAFGGLGDGLAALVYPLNTQFEMGWRALYLLAVVPVVPLIFMRRYLKESDHYLQAKQQGMGIGSAVLEMMQQRQKLLAMMAFTIAYHLPVSAALSLMSKHLQSSCSYEPSSVALLFIVGGSIALLGNLVGGLLTDKVGRRPGFALFSLLVAGGFGVFYLGECSQAPVAWVVALTGFFATHAIFLTIVGELFPALARATVAAIAQAVGAAALAAGLFLESYLYSFWGTHAEALATLLPSFLVAAFVLFLFLPETARRDLTERTRSE